MNEALRDFKKLVNNPTLSDVKFLVRDRILYGHRILLAARNEFFRALLYGTLSKETTEISDPNIEPDDFLSVMEFLYCGETTITPSNLFSLLYLSGQYRILELHGLCSNFLVENLSPLTALELWDSLLSLKEEEIAKQCERVICEYTEECIKYLKIDIHEETMLKLLQLPVLSISEIHLLTFFLNWDEKRKLKDEKFKFFLSLIRFVDIKEEEMIDFLSLSENELSSLSDLKNGIKNLKKKHISRKKPIERQIKGISISSYSSCYNSRYGPINTLVEDYSSSYFSSRGLIFRFFLVFFSFLSCLFVFSIFDILSF